MKCEEFEIIGLERIGRLLTGLDATQSAAAEHASTCPRCAALQESWQEARAALQDLRQVTDAAEAPQRVEMRLRQEFAMRHRTPKARSIAIFAAWTLATAALLFAGVSWWNWRVSQHQRALLATETTLGVKTVDSVLQRNDGAAADSTLVADNDAGDFTLLPGNLPRERLDSSGFAGWPGWATQSRAAAGIKLGVGDGSEFASAQERRGEENEVYQLDVLDCGRRVAV